MIGHGVRRRGEPLLVLGAIMLCWIGARAALWQIADPEALSAPSDTTLFADRGTARVADLAVPAVTQSIVKRQSARLAAGPAILSYPTFIAPEPQPMRLPVLAPPVVPVPSGPGAMLPIAPGLAGGHAMMWLAVVGQMPSPEALLAAAAMRPPVPASSVIPRQAAPSRRRWSADSWTFFRNGGGVASPGPSVATYGASQVGAVLRYRLMPDSLHKPTAYLRASAALNGSGERELAVGLSARPFRGIPVIVAAEGRIGQFSRRTVVRPAVMAVTEVAPFALPGQTRGEFYLQAGYVGGAAATPFVDGQLRVDRQVGRVGPVEVRAGASVWGGAQRGAGRLDVGPSATLGIAQGQAAARIGLDWRFRIKGEAEPSSGPALTISAGF